MTPKKDAELCAKYPMLYAQRSRGMRDTCMCWGFEIGDGWTPIIERLSEKLERINRSLPKDEPKIEASQVKEKFGCYDAQTEVLTRKGWKYFGSLSKDDEIASLKDGKFLEYEKPTDIIAYEYTGKMYKLRTRGVDLLVTPNHVLYVAKGTYWNGRYSPPKRVEYNLELTTYEKYYKKNKRFKKDAIWAGHNQEAFVLLGSEKRWSRGPWGQTGKKWEEMCIPMPQWLVFLGWYIAEGCVSKNEIAIACNNTDGGVEKADVRKAIMDIGFDPSSSMEERPAMVYKIYERRLCQWLKTNCGAWSKEKRVPEFVKDLTPKLIGIFLRTLFRGDGYKSKTSWILTTISKQLADDVQELILKAGQASTCYPARKRYEKKVMKDGSFIQGKHPAHEINWMKNGYHNTMNKGLAKHSKEELVDHDGMVYCVTVPAHVIYVRRNGIPVWCGNSLRFYTSRCHDEADRLITEAERESAKTCEECGKPGRQNSQGWITTLCTKCRRAREKKR